MSISSLSTFIEKGKTPYHVVDFIRKKLDSAGFTPLHEGTQWTLLSQQGYYLIREGSLIAFFVPEKSHQNEENSLAPYRIWGAHTDSPALKLRGPSSLSYQSSEMEKNHQGNNQVWGVEIYGSPILNTWLDRPLDISGRIFIHKTEGGQPEVKLWHTGKAKAVIPNAAIHLNREVNKSFSLNRETQLQALVTSDFKGGLKEEIAHDLNIKEEEILSMDLFLSDTQPPQILGGLIQSPKLDNLAMCHAGLLGLLEFITATKKESSPKRAFNISQTFPVLALFNNEEVGSRSSEGAGSNFIGSILTRVEHTLGYNFEQVAIKKEQSAIISADMAHAYHPGFDELYGKSHRAYLDGGIVLKRDSNLRYMSDAALLVKIKQEMEKQGLAYQEYFQHNNIPCGTTIGPHLSSQLGIKTLDLGTSILAMHSLRETGSVKDHQTITDLATLFFGQV